MAAPAPSTIGVIKSLPKNARTPSSRLINLGLGWRITLIACGMPPPPAPQKKRFTSQRAIGKTTGGKAKAIHLCSSNRVLFQAAAKSDTMAKPTATNPTIRAKKYTSRVSAPRSAFRCEKRPRGLNQRAFGFGCNLSGVLFYFFQVSLDCRTKQKTPSCEAGGFLGYTFSGVVI